MCTVCERAPRKEWVQTCSATSVSSEGGDDVEASSHSVQGMDGLGDLSLDCDNRRCLATNWSFGYQATGSQDPWTGKGLSSRSGVRVLSKPLVFLAVSAGENEEELA